MQYYLKFWFILHQHFSSVKLVLKQTDIGCCIFFLFVANHYLAEMLLSNFAVNAPSFFLFLGPAYSPWFKIRSDIHGLKFYMNILCSLHALTSYPFLGSFILWHLILGPIVNPPVDCRALEAGLISAAIKWEDTINKFSGFIKLYK